MKQTGKKLYELWEIYKDGKNGEVYEVAQCLIPSYIGTQLEVKVGKLGKGSSKCLVSPEVEGDGEDALAKLYGCLGTAKYRKVEQYTHISIFQALSKLNNYRTVYIENDAGEKVALCKYTSLSDVDVYTMADLMDANFYVKEPEKDVF